MIKKNVPFCDNNGCYVIVAGTLCQCPVVLVNVLTPNHDDESMKKLLSSILKLHSHYLILGVIWTLIDSLLDKPNPKATSPSKMAQALSQFIHPWRFLLLTDKQFTIFSLVRKSHSCIDYFVIDKTSLPSVASIKYLARVNSDHSPTSYTQISNTNPKNSVLGNLTFHFYQIFTSATISLNL